jgi:hypothetical protein
MLRLRKFMGSRTGVIICSILLGLGLSSIFKMSCDSNDCIIMKAPDMSDKKILKYNNKCYESSENIETCDSKKRLINV